MDWKKKLAIMLSGILMSFSLAGCGDTIPTLTDEENWKIAEYSAGLLLKYDAHNVRRLVSDEVINAAYAEALAKAEWEWRAQQFAEAQKQEEQADSSSEGNGSADATQQIVYSMEEILEISEVFRMDYMGYEIVDSYPQEDSEEFYVAMEATAGKKLLIVHYNLANLTENDIFLDILHSGATFSITMNDKKYGSQWTLLADDFTQYYETIQGLEEKAVSIIFEVPEEETYEIRSLSIKVKAYGKSGKFSL